jgi:hypothetical protein
MENCERCGEPTMVSKDMTMLIGDRMVQLAAAVCGECIALIVKEWLIKKREVKVMS